MHDLSLASQIHNQALSASSAYQKAERDLILIILKLDQHQIHIKRGHSSLFKYVTTELKLSEHAAYTLITIARKTKEIPELTDLIGSGAITVSNARRICAIITPKNKDEWLKKAAALSNRQLEKEIAAERPHLAVLERATYVAHDRIKLEIGLYERDMLNLRHVQDLLCQRKQRPVTLEETITTMTADYIKRYDPVEKAKQNQVKQGSAQPTQPPKTLGKLVTLPESPTLPERQPLTAKLKHQVNLRDKRRCTHILPDGTRCNQKRWVEIHHITPVSEGGTNTLENLTTLCSSHHRYWHQTMMPIFEALPFNEFIESLEAC